MAYVSEMDPETGFVARLAAKTRGQELRDAYQAARPFPHAVIDDFLPPAVLERALAEFPKEVGEDGVAYDAPQERYKFQYMPEVLPPATRTLFYAFNSLPFIQLLQNITGIKGLIPDPYFFGAGLHEIRQGGHLSIHADFNHHKPMDLQRRINVLIYLNKDWKDAYGGQLELWDSEMKGCEVSVLPLFNRCVIFNTDEGSNHGNPHPINHPDLISRKSIALYYYTATWDSGDQREYTTQFRRRPGSDDKAHWGVRRHEILSDLTPPLVFRTARRLRRLLKGEAVDGD